MKDRRTNLLSLLRQGEVVRTGFGCLLLGALSLSAQAQTEQSPSDCVEGLARRSKTKTLSIYTEGGLSWASGLWYPNVDAKRSYKQSPAVGAGIDLTIRPWVRVGAEYLWSRYRREQRMSALDPASMPSKAYGNYVVKMHDLPIALASSTSGPKKDGWVTRKYRLTSSNGRVRIDGKVTLLNCGGNGLTSLEVGNNAELKHLLCHNNSIQTLNLSANSNLEILDCNSNRLTRLDLSKNSNLRVLACHNNSITDLEVPELKSQGDKGQLFFYQGEGDGNRLMREKVESITSKKWDVQMSLGRQWVEYQGDHIQS